MLWFTNLLHSSSNKHRVKPCFVVCDKPISISKARIENMGQEDQGKGYMNKNLISKVAARY